jgi:flagellar basal-body rod protein FlgC
MDILAIAVSGLSAASLRVNVAASNIANASTTGPLPASGGSGTSAYVPLRVDQIAQSSGSTPGGTVATVSTVSPSFVAQYDPGAPFANQDGLVAAPNVDLVDEFVQLEIAKNSFIASAKVIQAYAEMTDTLLDIK